MSTSVKGKEPAEGSLSSGSTAIDPRQERPAPLSQYKSQKRRDWNTFRQYLKNQNPPVSLSLCNCTHVLEFLRYLDQFGKTKVHLYSCVFFGKPDPPAPCTCPLRQAWGSLDALIGRLRAAYEEHGAGSPERNPFGGEAIRVFLREVKEAQAKARGIAYRKKKKKKKKRKSTGNEEAGGDIYKGDPSPFDTEQKEIAVERTWNYGARITKYSTTECYSLEIEETFLAWCADTVKVLLKQPSHEERRLRRERSITMVIQEALTELCRGQNWYAMYGDRATDASYTSGRGQNGREAQREITAAIEGGPNPTNGLQWRNSRGQGRGVQFSGIIMLSGNGKSWGSGQQPQS
ncbi:hypothetical protein Scep_011650 [Stephania cephalantha]|uniref:ALOG domain-containing protein n=1 Tax=Stephania cephalantha TaxID=152367 RepID=A0AAP0JFQ9_9MAGN